MLLVVRCSRPAGDRQRGPCVRKGSATEQGAEGCPGVCVTRSMHGARNREVIAGLKQCMHIMYGKEGNGNSKG